MARKEYAGGAAATTLSSSVTNVSTSITVADATNWPTGAIGPFWIRIGAGQSNEEKIKCSSRSGNVLTVATGGRGGDGTTAISHDPPETVEHLFVREDAEEANQHINETTHDHHSQYLNTTRHDATSRHTLGTVVPAGASATASSPGQAGTGGVANSASRSDHAHAREGFGSPTASNPGDTAADGSAGTIARSDHRHARESAAGVPFGSVGNSAVGDAAANGVATSASRADHRHGRESFGNVTAQTAFTTAASNGAASTVARSDHVHGTPSLATAQAAETFSVESTSSTGYTDLPGDPQVIRTVPATGAVLIIVGGCVFNSGNNAALISFRATGANTISGSDARAFGTNGVEAIRGSRVTLLLGLTPGSTTFKTVERVDGGTGTYTERQLTVWPLS